MSGFRAKIHSASTPLVNREELVEYGSHCSEKSCNQLDFLPFKCPSCSLSFCAEHWKPEQHSCEKLEEAKVDVRSPQCPLCQSYVPLASQSQDPNIVMDAHLTSFCPVLNPSLAASSSKPPSKDVCGQCKKKFLPGLDGIECPGCHKKFCIKHRMKQDHNCFAVEKTNNGNGRVFGGGILGSNGRGTERILSPAALAAMKRAASSSPSLPSKPSSSATSKNPTLAPIKANSALSSIPTSHSTPNLSRTDRNHVKAEEASTLLALERRAQLGVLSENDKVRYATLLAERESTRRKDEDKRDGSNCAIC